MPNAVVDTNATQLAAADNRARMVRQLRGGTVTVYLGEDPQVTAGTGFPLEPGDVVTWEAGKALYAIASARTSVYLEAAATSVFQASAVADQLVASGLAQDIADRIQVGGAPSIDAPTMIADDTWTTVAGGHYVDPPGSFFNVARYQSVAITVQALMPAALTSLAAAQTGHVGVFHYAAGVLIGHDSIIFAGDNNTATFPAGATTFVIPALGDEISVFVDYGTNGVDVRTTIVASYRARSGLSCHQNHGFMGATGNGFLDSDMAEGYTSWTLNNQPAAGTTWSEYPLTWAGDCILNFDSRLVLGAGNVTVILNDITSNKNLYVVVLAGGVRITHQSPKLTLPARPVRVIVQNSTAAAFDPTNGPQVALTHDVTT